MRDDGDLGEGNSRGGGEKQWGLRERLLAELSDEGDDAEKGGIKDAARYGVLGAGYMPLTELQKTGRGNRRGAGVQSSIWERTSGLPGRAESEHIFQCFSHWNTCTPTEPLI